MLGHEHPGIKQRGMPMKSFDASGGAINEEMTDKIDKNPGSGINYGASVGSESPVKFFGAIRRAAKKLTAKAKGVVGAITGKGGAEAAAEGAVDDVPVEGGGEERYLHTEMKHTQVVLSVEELKLEVAAAYSMLVKRSLVWKA